MKYYSKRVYLEDGCKEGTLEVENGKIVNFYEGVNCADKDFGSNRIIPGIFDTHNHGVCGFDPADNKHGFEVQKQMVKGFLKGVASQGVTNVFPTAMALGEYKAIAEVAKETNDGAKILGIHSEGPWLSRVGEKGIRTGWPEISVDLAKQMVEESEGLLKLVAVAPEIPGAKEVIEYYLSVGVNVAAAHSDNMYKEANAAYEAGVSVSTHLGNVMTGLHHSDVGGLGAGLLNDKVTCEMICDGMHICNEMLQIYLKVKDHDKLMMISDCTALSGAPVGRYDAYGMVINITEEGFALSDTGRIMGSTQPVIYGIKNLVENVGVSLEEVIKFASLNPAKKYGFEQTKGSLKVGKDADFVVISDDYKALETYSEGVKVYDKETDGLIFNAKVIESIKIA